MTIYGAMSPQSETSSGPGWHATTILSVRKAGQVVMAGDGQVSMGQTIVKANAKKVRRLGNGQIVAGLPAPPRTPLPCSSGWRRSSSNIPAN